MSDGDAGRFAEQLRGFRERAALTQEELAARAGLTGKAVGALERGERRRPYPHTVRALADALELDDDEREVLIAASRPAAASATEPSQLPAPATRLIGRDADRAEIVDLLRSGATRLLTITGPGGVGKTSLALDVARALSADFPSGVAVAELAPVREPSLVLPTIARAIGAQHVTAPLLDFLAAFLGARGQLVVLDNVEHLLDAAGDVAELLARCPGLVVLATSRAPLRVRVERDHPLAALPVPAGPGARAVAASPAAQVFLDRARAAGRPVALTDATAADVAAICRRLDGLPLALELAAVHARFLTTSALLDRLGSAIASPGPRDLPTRQRTMRSTLDWSHALLTADEQRLLRRLGVFAGGFSLEAAAQVTGGDALPALAGLVEQSLVLVEDDGTSARYRMLEPIRQYAAGRLDDAGEGAEVADRAADFFDQVCSAAAGGLRTAAQAEWLNRLDRDHDNLSATLRRLIDRGDHGTAARLVGDTWLYWALRGHAVEGIGWMERIQDDGDAAPAPVRRAARHLALAGLRLATGDVERAGASAVAATESAREEGSVDLLAEALVLSSTAAVMAGALPEADELLAEAESLHHAGGTTWAAAHTAVARAQLLFRAGRPDRAVAALAQAERLARDLGNPFTLTTVLNMQASVALAAEDDGTALERWTEAAELAALVGSRWSLAYTLPGLAVLAARRGAYDLAARLFAGGSATAGAGSVAVTFPPDLEVAGRWLAAVRAALGEEAFRRAWDRGRGLGPGDVTRLADQVHRSARG